MIRHAVVYMGAVAIGQGASLLLLPIVTRFLDPVAYGEYTLVLATTALIGTFGSAWIRTVALRLHFDHTGRTRALFWTAAALQAAVMGALLGAGFIVVGAGGDDISAAAYLAGAAAALVADFYVLSLNTLRAGQRATAFGAAEFTSAFLRIGGTWLGLWFGFRSAAALFVFAAASVAVAAAVAWIALRGVLTGSERIEAPMVRSFVRLGMPSIPYAAGSWALTMSDRLLMAYFLDLGTVGVYAVAHGAAERTLSGLAAGLFMMTWPATLQAWTDQPARAPAAMGRFLGAYVLLTAGPAMLLALHHDILLRVLVGAEYRAAAAVVPFVAAGTWLIGLAAYFNRPIELQKRYGELSRITMAAAAVNLVLNVVLIPRFGVTGAAASTLCAGAVMAAASAVAGARVLRIEIPWRIVGGAAIATAVAALPAFGPWSSRAALAWFVPAYAVGAVVVWRRARGRPVIREELRV